MRLLLQQADSHSEFRSNIMSAVVKANWIAFQILQRQGADLVSIEDADELIGRDGNARRVDLRQAVVQIGRFSIHLSRCPLSAADIHKLVSHVLDTADRKTTIRIPSDMFVP